MGQALRKPKIMPFPSRARPSAGGGVGDGVVVGELHPRLEMDQHQHHEPTSSEKRLARWLRNALRFNGADAFVSEVGARLVLEALHDDVLIWEDGRWQPTPGLRNPAGLLRVQIRARLRRKV